MAVVEDGGPLVSSLSLSHDSSPLPLTPLRSLPFSRRLLVFVSDDTGGSGGKRRWFQRQTTTASVAKVATAEVCDPGVSVYKGHCLQNDTKAYLASHGLKDAIYTINAADVKDDLFGTLIPCPFQDVIGHSPLPADPGHSPRPADPSADHLDMAKCDENPTLLSDTVNGVWRTRHQNLISLHKEANELKDKFLSITVHHVKREFNSDADAEAGIAVDLPSGEVYEVSGES